MNATSFRPAGTLNADTALEPYRGPWNSKLAAHLLRRAGFGGSPDDVRRLAGMPMHDAVDGLVNFPSTAQLPSGPPNLTDPLSVYATARQMGALPAAGSPEALELRKQFGMARRQAGVALIEWWLGRMLVTPAPLQEKMTLFWHGHFTSAYGAKGITPQDALAQNQLFRANALGNIHALTLAVSQDPAMLKYLDNARNDKAHPNENYARELMELFTLGIGNYTEADVRESARAFTGWTVRGRPSAFYFNAANHDDGTKTFLGQTGNFDGKDVVDIIFANPASARFFAEKLLAFFVYSDPEPQLIDAVAALLRKNNFELRPVMATILRSNVLYSDRAYRALVKSPVEFVVGTQQLFGIKDVDRITLGRALAHGTDPVVSAQRQRLGRRRCVAQQRDRARRAKTSPARSCNRRRWRSANSWLTQYGTMKPDAVAARLCRRRSCRAMRRRPRVAKLEAYLNGDGHLGLGDAVLRELRRTRAWCRVSHHGHARLPTRLGSTKHR